MKSKASISILILPVLFCGVTFLSSKDSLAAAPLESGRLVLRAVGQVGEQVISSRDVILASVVEEWLYAIQDRPSETLRRKEKEAWFLSVESPKFQSQLSRVLIDVMINLEAENFNVAEVSPAELQRLSTRFMIDVATLEFWKRWTPTPSEAQLLLRRKLRAKAFLDFKSEGSRDMISDEEARRYYDSNKAKFGNFPFDQFKNSIKDALTRERVEARLRDWFEGLKKKYKVRILSPPAAAEAAAVPAVKGP